MEEMEGRRYVRLRQTFNKSLMNDILGPYSGQIFGHQTAIIFGLVSPEVCRRRRDRRTNRQKYTDG